ncbi:MAG: cation:proton antiporter [Patescibacteria group bacterium]
MYELALVVIVAALLAIVMRMLKQPLVLAYLATGLLFSALGLYHIASNESFSLLSDLGVMFLLFLVGLEINYTSIKMVGKTAVLLGLGQILLTFGVGFVIALLFHFSTLTAAYIAIALTFSSTIIVVKLLSEKKDLNSLYGKISIGFLLVQDFVAILLLVVLSGGPLVSTLIKGVVLLAVMFWLGRKAIPLLFNKIGRSQELLFIVSLAWVFVVTSIVQKLGFSVEIAGFLAGIGLANSYENFQIASHIRPLRDFFILIFFVMLGASITFFNFAGLGWPIIIFSLFVLIGNPLIVLVLMGLTGYRRRTSFMTGITMAQVSEFSLILAALGFKLHHINEQAVGLITAVGVITIVVSTYLIIHGDSIVQKLWHMLAVFEKLDPLSEDGFASMEFHRPTILIGAQRIGHIIASHIRKDELLIIDFDPSVVERFKKHGYACLLGDISDRDIFEKANFDESKLVICTSPDVQDNLSLLTQLRHTKGPRKIILRADNDHDSTILYKKGADYVIRPHLTSGHYIGEILGNKEERDRSLWHAREKDFKIVSRELQH